MNGGEDGSLLMSTGANNSERKLVEEVDPEDDINWDPDGPLGRRDDADGRGLESTQEPVSPLPETKI